MENFQIINLPHSLGLWFSECQLKLNISIGHYEEIEKLPPFNKYESYGRIPNYQPPKFAYKVLTEMEYQHWPL